MLVFVWYVLLYVHSSFAIILTRKRELVALILLSFACLVTVNVLWLFLVVPWVGLQCVIVVFPDHTHSLFISYAGYQLFIYELPEEKGHKMLFYCTAFQRFCSHLRSNRACDRGATFW